MALLRAAGIVPLLGRARPPPAARFAARAIAIAAFHGALRQPRPAPPAAPPPAAGVRPRPAPPHPGRSRNFAPSERHPSSRCTSLLRGASQTPPVIGGPGPPTPPAPPPTAPPSRAANTPATASRCTAAESARPAR
jgi:hypothetical protein